MSGNKSSNITLYTAATPNGVKISMTLEELGLKYDVKALSFSSNEQKEESFLKINPNGRIPALTDTFTDGKEIRVFESGSIMQYLIARYDPEHKLSYPAGSRENVEVNNWLFFQNSGVGPMQGQANHFLRYAPEKIQYGIDRYQNETRRLYGTLEKHLKDTGGQFLVGDRCTIADISHVGWLAACEYAGVSMTPFPLLSKWLAMMLERPGIRAGRDVPTKHTGEMTAEEREKQAEEGKKWIQQGMQQDRQQK